MALVLADRVQELTTTAGTGTITLAGAVTGYQSFSTAIGNGNTTYYTIAGGSEWEVGIGTYTSAGNTLSRDTVLASSAGGTTKVTFSAGTKNVFVTYPAEKSVNYDASNNVGIGTTIPAYRLTVIGSDTTNALISGTTKGVRFAFNSSTSRVEGVDGTGAASYQPLDINGSIVTTSISGTEKMRLDASGNLGIGTSSPAVRLDVNNGVADATQWIRTGTGYSATLFLKPNGSGGGLQIQAASSETATIYNTLNSPLTFGTNNTERMRITSAGDVGIGTNAPQDKLEVYGGNVRSALAGTSTATLRGFAMASGTTEFASLKAEASLGETRLTSGFTGFGGFTTFYTNGTERMRLDAAGNVGIGTSSPGVAVDVYRNTAATASYRIQNANTAYDSNFIASDGSGSAAFGYAGSTYGGYQGIVASGSYWYATGAGGIGLTTWNASAAIKFFTNSGSERMRITAAGNVGIGTSAPQGLLHVVAGTNDTLLLRGPINLGTGGSIYAVNSANNTVTPMEFGASAYYFAGGYVGIGTSSPTNMLSVAGTINSNNLLMQGDGSNAYIRPTNAGSSLYLGAANSNYIQLASDGSTYFNVGGVSNTHQFLYNESGGEIQLVDSTGAGPILLDNSGGLARLLKVGSGSMAVGTTSTGSLRFQTADTERMRIDGSGNVGIGTSAPLSFGGYGWLTINGTSTGGNLSLSAGNSEGFRLQYTSGNAMYLNTIANLPMIFLTNNTERLRIDSTGAWGLSGANYGTSGQVLTSNGSGSAPTWQSASSAVSYPQNVQSGNYTLVLSDAGKQIYSANSAAQTITIPTNASVAFPIGTLITIVNMGTFPIRVSGSGVSIFPNGGTTALSFATVASGQNVQIVKTDTNSWNCTFGSLTNGQFSYLIVAGGGAGGGVPAGGGGGAGGMLTGVSNVTSGTLTITVGGGGASTSAQGNNSSISGIATAFGGGGGGPTTSISINGGSGGGCNQGYNPSQTVRGGVGLYGQGNSGGGSLAGIYCGGGGGGAGAVGTNVFNYDGGTGGAGLASSITGSSVTYAGGGGGGTIYAPSSTGGAGGGGSGGGNANNGGSGTANTGGGGGGAGDYSYPNAGAGGSGVVIISTPIAAASTTGSPTVTTSGGMTIYKFTSSGTITW